MGATKIDWADRVWNPVTGCSPISPGCDHCYAQRMAWRLAGRYGYPAQNPFRATLHQDKLTEPIHWRKPQRIFVSSMGDLFHEDVPTPWLFQVWKRMAACPQHTFMILTKRPQRMREFVLASQEQGWDGWDRGNLWLGVTAEDQQRADERIPVLLETPAARRFVSCEPLLGPIDLTHIINARVSGWLDVLGGDRYSRMGEIFAGGHGLDWVIAGGETGPGARPMHPDWAESLRDQAITELLPFFFKSWGEWAPFYYLTPSGAPLIKITCDRREVILHAGTGPGAHPTNMRRVGKAAAGNLLDGVEFHEWPE